MLIMYTEERIVFGCCGNCKKGQKINQSLFPKQCVFFNQKILGNMALQDAGTISDKGSVLSTNRLFKCV